MSGRTRATARSSATTCVRSARAVAGSGNAAARRLLGGRANSRRSPRLETVRSTWAIAQTLGLIGVSLAFGTLGLAERVGAARRGRDRRPAARASSSSPTRPRTTACSRSSAQRRGRPADRHGRRDLDVHVPRHPSPPPQQSLHRRRSGHGDPRWLSARRGLSLEEARPGRDRLERLEDLRVLLRRAGDQRRHEARCPAARRHLAPAAPVGARRPLVRGRLPARRCRWLRSRSAAGAACAQYALFWIVPMLTVLQPILRLRAICEHGAVTRPVARR